MNIQIDFNGLPHSDAVEQDILQRLEKLEDFHAGIIACHVSVESPHKSQQHGRLYQLQVRLSVPDGEIVSNCDRDMDIYVALRDVFDTSERQLKEYAQRRRGEVKHHEKEAMSGP